MAHSLLKSLTALSLSLTTLHAAHDIIDVTPTIGTYTPADERDLQSELTYDRSKLTRNDATLKRYSATMYGLNFLYHFPNEESSVTPYLQAGFGQQEFNNHTRSIQDGAYVNWGAGLKAELNPFSALRLDMRHLYNTIGDHSDMLMGLGLSFNFGQDVTSKVKPHIVEKRIEVEKAVEVEKVVIKEVPTQCTPAPLKTASKPLVDLDKDGIGDEMDMCEATPQGVMVDSDGCTALKSLTLHYNETRLTPANMRKINHLAKLLKRYHGYGLKITAHTDDRGSYKGMRQHSKTYAKEVAEAFVNANIDPKRLQTKGYGKLKPIALNDTPKNRAKNRRITLELIVK